MLQKKIENYNLSTAQIKWQLQNYYSIMALITISELDISLHAANFQDQSLEKLAVTRQQQLDELQLLLKQFDNVSPNVKENKRCQSPSDESNTKRRKASQGMVVIDTDAYQKKLEIETSIYHLCYPTTPKYFSFKTAIESFRQAGGKITACAELCLDQESVPGARLLIPKDHNVMFVCETGQDLSQILWAVFSEKYPDVCCKVHGTMNAADPYIIDASASYRYQPLTNDKSWLWNILRCQPCPRFCEENVLQNVTDETIASTFWNSPQLPAVVCYKSAKGQLMSVPNINEYWHKLRNNFGLNLYHLTAEPIVFVCVNRSLHVMTSRLVEIQKRYQISLQNVVLMPIVAPIITPHNALKVRDLMSKQLIMN